MRIIVMGTGPFAVPMLDAILAAGHDVPTVVTRPRAAPHGRKKPLPNPMCEAAEQHALTILDPPDINHQDAQAQLIPLKPDLLAVCDFGQLLSSSTLSVARLGGINLHGSLLPKYRGAAPVQWALIQGEPLTGVTVIHMTTQLDGGPTLCQRETPIDPCETAVELENRLAQLGAPAVVEAIDILAHWNGTTELGIQQDNQHATLAPRLQKQQGNINWTATSTEIINLHRALQPWPGCFTHWQRPSGEPLRLIIKGIEMVADTDAISRTAQTNPGTILGKINPEAAPGLWVATGDGYLSITRLQPAGKRVMDIDEFQRGYPLQEGDALG